MLKTQSISPVVRAILVVGAVAALVTGVTFAALDSEATLTSNRVASATAGLQVDNTDDPDTGLGSTDVGFAFTGLVPGREFNSAPAHHFSLNNNGTTGLRIKVKASAGTATGTIDKSEVFFEFTNTTNTSSTPEVYTLEELETAAQDLPGVSDPDNLAVGQTNNFEVRARLGADAVTGSSASFDGFTLTFEGHSFVE